MILAHMIAVSKEDLICDLAETYGVYDMRSLPASTVAILAKGLRPESRIKSRLVNNDVDFDRLLRARTVDLLSILVWQRTADGMKGRNLPKSITDMLLGQNEPKKPKELKSFRTAEDFHTAWKAGGGG